MPDLAVNSAPQYTDVWSYQYDLDPALLPQHNVVGGWGTTVGDPVFPNGGYFGNGYGAPAAAGDTIEFRWPMASGRYYFWTWIFQKNDGGRITMTMNGKGVFAGFNFYAAVPNPFGIYLFGGVIQAQAGIQSLVINVIDKVPASAGYFLRWNLFRFTPYLLGAL